MWRTGKFGLSAGELLWCHLSFMVCLFQPLAVTVEESNVGAVRSLYPWGRKLGITKSSSPGDIQNNSPPTSGWDFNLEMNGKLPVPAPCRCEGMRWSTLFFQQHTTAISSGFFASCLEKWWMGHSVSYLFGAFDIRWWPHIYFLSTSVNLAVLRWFISSFAFVTKKKCIFPRENTCARARRHLMRAGR